MDEFAHLLNVEAAATSLTKLTQLCIPLGSAGIHRLIEKLPGVALGCFRFLNSLDLLNKAVWQNSVLWWLRDEDQFEGT
jgi:hypothetical protein